jgi:hypothetical protein
MSNKLFIERITEALKDKPLKEKKETLDMIYNIYDDVYGKTENKKPSAYNVFFKEQTLKLKEENSTLSGKEKKDFINNLWKTVKENK